MKTIPSTIHSDYAECNIAIDVNSKYVFCDIAVPFEVNGGLSDLKLDSVTTLPDSGIYEHNGVQFGIFKVASDGELPFHEADELCNPELVLLNCDSYFKEDDPLDYCQIDSGCVAFIPAAFLPPGMEPINAGPVVNFSLFEEENYENSETPIYFNSKGIYVIDYFLVRDIYSWKR